MVEFISIRQKNSPEVGAFDMVFLINYFNNIIQSYNIQYCVYVQLAT
jgi:hypothetical protein